jgi:chemotaxis protein MotB
MTIDENGSAHDGQSENYFVSMTDMMVGMLFIFIILLMSFALIFRQQTDLQETTTTKQRSKIEYADEVARRLEDIETRIRRQIEETRQAGLLRHKLLIDIDAQLRREGLIVQIDESNGVLRLTEDTVRFPVMGATLIGRARENVGKIARVLTRVLPSYAVCPETQRRSNCQNKTEASVETVFIEGHTDETGMDEQNWILSAQRAANTYRELTAVSPELRRIFNRRNEEILSISGYSSTRPIDHAGNSSAWDKNRRIDLRFVMDTNIETDLEDIRGLLQRMRSAIEELKGTP